MDNGLNKNDPTDYDEYTSYKCFLLLFFGFLTLVKLTFKTHCRNDILSSLFPIFCRFFCVPHSLYLFILHYYAVCLSRLLGLLMFGKHEVICLRRFFDLHTWSAQLIRTLFKFPIMSGPLHSSSRFLLLRISYYPSLFLFGLNIYFIKCSYKL